MSDNVDFSGFRSTLRAARYDLGLAIIPSAFVVALLVANLLSIAPRTALVLASVIGTFALLDALFLNPPGRGDAGRFR